MADPSVLLVGDNTDQLNIGGRAHSLALSSQIDASLNLTETIPGDVVNGWGPYVGAYLPNWLYRKLRTRRADHEWVDSIVSWAERHGAGDYLTNDPSTTAANIITHADSFDKLGRIRRAISETDVVVINGEGSGVFGSPIRRDLAFYLAVTELALRYEKQVFYVNALFSDSPVSPRNDRALETAERLLSRCTEVLPRDRESLDYVSEHMPSVECQWVPDALFAWHEMVQDPSFAPPAVGDFVVSFPENQNWLSRFDLSTSYVVVSGSSLSAKQQERAFVSFKRLVERLTELGIPVYLLQADHGDRFLERVAHELDVPFIPVSCPAVLTLSVIAGAQVLTSGRYHPSIAGAMGGTPMVFLEASSHKIRSVKELLGCGDQRIHSAYPDRDDVDSIVTRVKSLLEDTERHSAESVRLAKRAADLSTRAAQLGERIAEAVAA